MSKISGFYYDRQKKNILTSMSLHSNTKCNKDGSKWSTTAAGVKDESGYYLKPICRAIVNEDFQIGIVNNWSDFNPGNPLGSMFDSIRQHAPTVGIMEDALRDWNPSGLGEKIGKIFGDGAQDLFHRGAQLAKDYGVPALDVAGDYLNRTLITQGNRFTYYSGTDVSFGNLGLKFTIFADWVATEKFDGTEGPLKFMTVNEQLSDMIPYFIGKYVPFWEENEANGINTFLGWQKPPGGYRANLKSIYKENTTGSSLLKDQEGTLKLRIGGYYALTNLVIRDVQLNFSKQMIKNPVKDYTISPLFCEVSLQLQPCVKYTDHAIKDFVGGVSTESERGALAMDLSLEHALSKDY